MPSRTSKRPRRAVAGAAPPEPGDAPREIYAVVRAIPRGRIVTYGQLAELAGVPRGHRVAARAMRVCPSGLPWHRVLAKKDARRAAIGIVEPDHAALQRRLLEREGITFDAGGFVALRDFGWLPVDAATPRGRARLRATARRR